MWLILYTKTTKIIKAADRKSLRCRNLPLHVLFPGHTEKPTLITGDHGVQKIFMFFNFVNNFIKNFLSCQLLTLTHTYGTISAHTTFLHIQFCFQNFSHHFLVNLNLSCKQLSFLTAVLTFPTHTSLFIITRQGCHWLFSAFFLKDLLVPFKHIRSLEGIFSICLTLYIKGLGGTVQFRKKLEYLLITIFFKPSMDTARWSMV